MSPITDDIENYFGPVIYRYTSEQAVEDGLLFDVDLIQKHWKNCPIKFITTGLLGKGYWTDRCKNAVLLTNAGKVDRCASCAEFKNVNQATGKLKCSEVTLNVPNVHDLLHQVLEIFNKAANPKDWFLSGQIELPSGSKQKVFIAQNETGRYTVMLPEEY
jgi:hypothetical protein